MNTQILTPWFSPSDKPVRRGVYKTKFYSTSGAMAWEGYSFWNGKQWRMQANTIDQAKAFSRRTSGVTQAKHWRGLAGVGEQGGE